MEGLIPNRQNSSTYCYLLAQPLNDLADFEVIHLIDDGLSPSYDKTPVSVK